MRLISRAEAAARIFGAPVIWAHDAIAPGRSCLRCVGARHTVALHGSARRGAHPPGRSCRLSSWHLQPSSVSRNDRRRHRCASAGSLPLWRRQCGHINYDRAKRFPGSGVDLLEKVVAGQRLGMLLDLWGNPQEASLLRAMVLSH